MPVEWLAGRDREIEVAVRVAIKRLRKNPQIRRLMDLGEFVGTSEPAVTQRMNSRAGTARSPPGIMDVSREQTVSPPA
jgi:hypothetical protein